MPAPDAWCVAYRPLEIFTGGSQCLVDGVAEGKVRGKSGRKGAAGPVRVRSGQPRPAKLELSGTAQDEIDRLRAVEVPALHHYDARPKR